MSKVKLYSPPRGTYDMPYTWVYNLGATPADGNDLLNQFVYIQAGYGDFIMRRVVGLSRVLQGAFSGPPPTAGKYRLYDRYKNALQSDPLALWQSTNTTGEQDLGICPEEFYQETGRIGFDLYNIARFPATPNASQVAFQGVRRVTGPYQRNPNYRAKARTFTYEIVQVIPDVFPAGPFTARLKVDDYDFELYNIIILQDSNIALLGGGEATLTIALGLVPGVTFTFEIVQGVGLNVPFSFTFLAGVATYTLPTDGAGLPVAVSGAQILNAWNTTPAAVAAASMTLIGNPSDGVPTVTPPVVVGPGIFGAHLADTVASLLIYDGNKRPISSAPVLDIYLDGSSADPIVNGFPTFGNVPIYGDGAIVPPLYYPKDTQIQIDFFSQIETQTVPPVTLRVLLIGKQYYPC